MNANLEAVQASESGKSGLAKLVLLSLLTGAAIGLVIGCFRVALDHMNTARTETITWAHQWPVLGFVLAVPRLLQPPLLQPGWCSAPGNLRLAAGYPMSRR